MKKMTFFCFFSFLLLAPCLYAQQSDAPKSNEPKVESQEPEVEKKAKLIVEVEVLGNKNVSGATILSKVRSQKGVLYSAGLVSEDIKTLYGLGYFTDVKVELEDMEGGLKLIFLVTEKPLLKEIALKGINSLREESVRKLIKSKVGDFASPRQLKADCEEIYKLYEKKGYAQAKVDYLMDIDEKTNEAKVTFAVDEAVRLKIRKIYLQGNRSFSNNQIYKLMSTRWANLWRPGFYKKETLDEDLEKIKSFYRQAGFLDTEASATLESDETKRNLYITVNIEEGKKYLVGSLKFSGNKVFSEVQLIKTIKLVRDATFSEDMLRDDLNKLQEFYFEKGYISAEIRPLTNFNKDTGRIDISYEIVENDIAYVNQIKVKGNTKTKDMVIRRELRIYPGEAFDGKKLQKSKERLYNLGFFEEVNYDTEPTTEPNKKDLVVRVKETKTGEFTFGAGFSSIDRFMGFVQIAQKNFDLFNFPSFTGAGQDLSLRAQLGSTRQDFMLSFTEPWIFDYPLSFGFDAYSTLQTRSGSSGYAYDEKRQGGDLRLAKEFTDNLRLDSSYKYENVTISNLPEGASQGLRDEEGKNAISSLYLGLTWDTRNNVYNPAYGMLNMASAEYAGGFLQGDKNFTKYNLGSNFYHTIFEKLLLELKFSAGVVSAFGDSGRVPIYERFFAGGGDSIRGYPERGVGPRDISGEPVGGEAIMLGSIEADYPVVQFIKAALFFDAGNVWEKMDELASGNFKYSIGAGVRVKTPIGPVKLDYGYPLKVDPGQKKEGRFHFSMSRDF
jgi:outer membrane protein insertion porin family